MGDDTRTGSGVVSVESGGIVTDGGDGPSIFGRDPDTGDVFTKCLQNAATCMLP